ncbi:MAG: hypothetical protein FJ284_12430 [Planctomycetes bacterium]|nr:hypothetical protein [Planctomycetota bacterium]
MIRDLVRTACVIVAMAVAAALLIETRQRLAVVDLAHRQALGSVTPAGYVPAPTGQTPEPPGPLARLGRATVGWADAALGVVR